MLTTKNKIIRIRVTLANKLITFCLDHNLDYDPLVSFIIRLYGTLLMDTHELSHKKSNHHFVPQFLLKKFSIPGTGEIFEYTHLRKRPLRVSIEKKAACHENLYTTTVKVTKAKSDFIENRLFALSLERFSSRVINKIIREDDIQLTSLEKSILTHFVAFQYVRTPTFLQHIKMFLEYLYLDRKVPLEEMVEQDFYKKAFFDNKYSIKPYEILEFSIKSNLTLKGADNIVLTIAMNIGNKLGELIYSRNIGMLTSLETEFFYLTDNPSNIIDLSRSRTLGPFLWRLDRAALIYLPITPTKCIYYFSSNVPPNAQMIGRIIQYAISDSMFEYAYSDRNSDEIQSIFKPKPSQSDSFRI